MIFCSYKEASCGDNWYIRVRGYDEYDGGSFGFVVSKLS